MSFQVELHPEVINELQESFEWYEMRSEGLGKRFLSAVNKRMNELALNPEQYAKKKKNYRAVAVDTFPYVIVFEILQKEKIVFVSFVFHTKRNPHLKYKR